MSSKGGNISKGAIAEEALRAYFRDSGYVVVRGARVAHESAEVTDIDLFLFGRPSAISRERVNVDVKNKRSPQALERVLWAKGVQAVLSADHAIVATSDKNPAVRRFADLHGIRVLDGEFLNKIIDRYGSMGERLSEERVYELLNVSSTVNSEINWKLEYILAKERVVGELNFNSLNKQLSRTQIALQDLVASASNGSDRLRCLYLMLAILCVMFDYVTSKVAHMQKEKRREIIEDGVRYGDSGKNRIKQIVDTTLGLLNGIESGDLFTRQRIENEVERQMIGYSAEVLGEYCARSDIAGNMLRHAREFEQAGYREDCPDLADLEAEAKSLVGVLADFWGVPRRNIF